MVLKLITTCAAVAGIFISSASIYISVNQNKMSNKQFLFNERLKIISMTEIIKNLIDQNERPMNKVPDDYNLNDIDFSNLTNHDELYKAASIIDDVKNRDKKILFLTKINELKSMGAKSEFVFEENISDILKNYLLMYSSMLFVRYQLQICTKNYDEAVDEDAKKTLGTMMGLNIAKLNEATLNLKEAHDVYLKKESEIKKEIRIFNQTDQEKVANFFNYRIM